MKNLPSILHADKKDGKMKEKRFQVKDNPYFAEQVIEFIEYNTDEKKDLMVTIRIEKI